MRAFVLSILLLATLSITAQWSLDPADPLVVCDAGGIEQTVRSVEDGNGGWYVFWRDPRAGTNAHAIYGQHYDADGIAQWSANGDLIQAQPGSNILDIQVERLDNGRLMLMYTSSISGGPDSLRASLLEPTGSPVWSEPVVVGHRLGILLSFEEFAMQASNNGVLVAYHAIVTGGGAVNKIDRINADGSLVYGINGLDVGSTAFGPMGMEPDGEQGAFVHWRNSNGGGTHMGVFRLDSMCVELWPSIVDPVAGTVGLGSTYNAVSDGQGGLAIAYVESQGNGVQFARLDGNGLSMITPATKPVGVFSSTQEFPELILHDGHFYVCWQDNRPPASNMDLFIQKLDMNGDPVWAPEGVPAVLGQTYVPHSRIVPTDSSGVIVVQLQTTNGFVAQRIRADGTTAWPQPVTMATQILAPFYGEMTCHADPATNGAVTFWYNSNDKDLYAAHVDFYGNLGDHTGMQEHPGNAMVRVFPNPSSGLVSITTDRPSLNVQVIISDVFGRIVHEERRINGNGTSDLRHLNSGAYSILLRSAAYQASGRVVIE